jgi:hypothetical protein
VHEGQPELACLRGAQRELDDESADFKLAAGLWHVIASEDVDQGRLPRPVLSEQTVDLAAPHSDAHLVQRLRTPEPL